MGKNLMKGNSHLAGGLIAASTIGVLAWHGNAWGIGALVSIPSLVFTQKTHLAAGLVALSYYAAASWPVVTVSKSYLASSSFSLVPISVWIIASLLLASPWLVAWTVQPGQMVWRNIGALLVTAVPPLGLIGWASPLTAAGVLFPGTGWCGIAAVAILPMLLLRSSVRILMILAATIVSAITNIVYTAPTVPPGFVTVDTHISSRQGHSDPEAEFAADQTIQSSMLRQEAKVIILPEGVVEQWTDAKQAFWEPTLVQLASAGKTALIGVTKPIPGSAQFFNAILVAGAAKSELILQRVPVPLGMWKPIGPKDGVPLQLRSPGTFQIENQRLAILICYEQLLVWPILQSVVERPTVLVGIANERWTSRTNVPAAQRACLHSWGRLFRIPVLAAVNT